MSSPRSNNPMFRRLLRRLLFANRGRLFVILLALSTGAAVSAALLNLQTDAKHRITSDFSAFGPNIIVSSRESAGLHASLPTIDQAIIDEIPSENDGSFVTRIGSLYLIANVSKMSKDTGPPVKETALVLESSVGFTEQGPVGGDLGKPEELVDGLPYCNVGMKVANLLDIHSHDKLVLTSGQDQERCSVDTVLLKGGPGYDERVFLDIRTAQRLTGKPGKVSLIATFVPGSSRSIESYLTRLRQKLPDVSVRPLRQFTDAQAKIYARISGLLTAATTLILILTGLCVMAAMTNIAAERKHDVGMMKAIGGSARGILNLFLTEAALLGLAGGLIGAAAGIALSMALGKAVFGMAAAPRLIVYPISVTLTVIVAILGAYPLRRLANVRPATIFRGDA